MDNDEKKQPVAPKEVTSPDTPETPSTSETPVAATTPESPASMPPMTTPEGHTSKNVIIIAVLAVIVIVLSLMYLWGIRAAQQEVTLPSDFPAEPAMPQGTPSDMQQAELSTSTDINAIETDLDSTSLDNIDSDVAAMEADLDAALSQ